MKTPHTPGPWTIREGGNTFHTLHVNAGSKKICLMNASNKEANARLIAASPSLYEFAQIRASQGDELAKSTIDSLGLTY